MFVIPWQVKEGPLTGIQIYPFLYQFLKGVPETISHGNYIGNKSYEEQLETALNAAAKPVDAGLCNGYYFLSGVGIGFDGEVVQAMGKKRFISAGHLAYLWTVIK